MVSGDHIEAESMTAVLLPVDPRLLERDDLTVDDLVDLPEDLRYELIEGRLVLTPHAVTIHNFIGRKTADAIEEFSPHGFSVDQEQAVLRNRRNELCPDVMILRDESATRSPVRPADVLLVVEVVSKSSKAIDRREKLEWYAEMRIPSYWIIDPLPERVTLTEFRLGPAGYRQQLQTTDLITLDETWKVTLDLPAWTRKRDYYRDVARADV
jgi:Uma2 family endonuclease